MSGPVLIEGRNLAMREGTGIATYARNLAETVRGLGHETDVVFDVDFPLSRHRAQWNETKLYDVGGRSGARPGFRTRMARALDVVVSSPLGVTAREVADDPLIIDANLFPSLQGFSRRQAVERLFLRAERHLLQYGRRLPLRPLRQPGLFHATHPTPIHVAGCANIYTVHDLVPLRLPHMTLDNKRVQMKLLAELARRADRIVTVSEHSRRDILRFLPVDESRVVNTYQAVSLPEALLKRDEASICRDIEAFGLEPQDYFLFLGAVEPKKNVERLIDAYLSSGSRRPLVIVGKLGWGYEKVVTKIESVHALAKLSPRRTDARTRPAILQLSYLPFAQVVSLLKGARALLFPSLYEGFGLPALEAMLLGTPVLASTGSSLPEVVGEAALLVDPLDMSTIAEAIRALDCDDDLRADLSSRGPAHAALFSPKKYADRVTSLYSELM